MYSNQVFKNTTTGELFDIFTPPTTNIIPSQDATYDLGSSNKRWASVYTSGVILGSSTSSLNFYKSITGNLNLTGYALYSSTTYSAVRVGNNVCITVKGLIIPNSGSSSPITSEPIDIDFAPVIDSIYKPIYATMTGNPVHQLLYCRLDNTGTFTITRSDNSTFTGLGVAIDSFSFQFLNDNFYYN